MEKLIETLRLFSPCEESMVWLRDWIEKNPTGDLEKLWLDLMKLTKLGDEKIVAGGHRGKSWISWLCLHVLHIQCCNGTYSGIANVCPGAPAEKLKNEIIEKMREIIK